MPEEPAKLDETLDAQPYEPPKQGRRRLTVAICVATGLVLLGTVAAMAVRYFCVERQPSFDYRVKHLPRTYHEVEAYTSGNAGSVNVRIAVGMTKAEVRDVIAHGRQPKMVLVKQFASYNFGPNDVAMYATNSWQLVYGPEEWNPGIYDDITLTFDDDKATKIMVASRCSSELYQSELEAAARRMPLPHRQSPSTRPEPIQPPPQ